LQVLTIDSQEHTALSLRNPRSDERIFSDARGRRWLVYERAANNGHFPQTPCLIFESLTAVRRIHEYPSDWRALDTPALGRLSGAR
jgi:hypothetical protein